MSIPVTPVSKCLDKKLKILGFEVPDLLLVFLVLSILNFLFGGTNMKLALVWAPSLVVALVLRIGKRDKPDNYLVHLARFYLMKKRLSAFKEPTDRTPPPQLSGEL